MFILAADMYCKVGQIFLGLIYSQNLKQTNTNNKKTKHIRCTMLSFWTVWIKSPNHKGNNNTRMTFTPAYWFTR